VFKSRQGQETLLFSKRSRPALGPSLIFYSKVPGLFPEIQIKPPLSSTEVRNGWSYTSTPPTCLHDVDRNNFTFLVSIYLSMYYLIRKPLACINCDMSYLYKPLQAHICLDFRLSWFWNDCLPLTWVACDLRARDCSGMRMRCVEKSPSGGIGLAALHSASSQTEIKTHHLQTNGYLPRRWSQKFPPKLWSQTTKTCTSSQLSRQ
jgi:hypothetical protein